MTPLPTIKRVTSEIHAHVTGSMGAPVVYGTKNAAQAVDALYRKHLVEWLRSQVAIVKAGCLSEGEVVSDYLLALVSTIESGAK